MIKVDCGLALTGEPIPQDPESLAAITTGARTQTGFINFPKTENANKLCVIRSEWLRIYIRFQTDLSYSNFNHLLL